MVKLMLGPGVSGDEEIETYETLYGFDGIYCPDREAIIYALGYYRGRKEDKKIARALEILAEVDEKVASCDKG